MYDQSLPGPSQIVPDTYGYSNPQTGVLQDYTGYKDYRTVNPYEFLEHTYEGSKHYRDCGYLQHTDREMFYQTRRKISYYVNVFKPIINAMVDPIFAGNIRRETDNILFEEFIDNCDNAGTSLNTFMKNALKHARLFSINFIVMDNFKSDMVQQADTMADQKEQRNIPYIYERKPHQVYEHICDDQGKLISITFLDKYEELQDDNNKIDCRQYYRTWDNMTWELWYIKDKKIIIEDQGTHGLGIIPVIVISNFASSANIKTLPNPEFYNLAVMVHGLFNKESQVCYQEIMQTFAILCTSGMGSNAKSLGPATFLDSGTDSKYPPQYVAPPQDGIKTLIDNCERLKLEIKDEAKQSGVIGVVEAKSGIAKEWDFRAEESVLEETAEAGEEIEENLAELFSVYIGGEVNYDVEYPDSFDPSADENDINSALAILKEMPPPEIAKNLWIDIAERRWKKDPEKLQSIKNSIENDFIASKEIEKIKLDDMMNREPALE